MVADGAPYLVRIGDGVGGFDFGMTSTGVLSMMDWKVRRNPVAQVWDVSTHKLSIDLNGSTYYVMLHT